MKRPPKPKRQMYPCRRLGTKKDGLTWIWKWPKWEWYDDASWHGGPGYQLASASKEVFVNDKYYRVTLETLEWGSHDNGLYYSANIVFSGDTLLGYPHAFEEGCATRIKAQFKAEKLFHALCQALGGINC